MLAAIPHPIPPPTKAPPAAPIIIPCCFAGDMAQPDNTIESAAIHSEHVATFLNTMSNLLGFTK